jgi:hypothetical protein
MCAVVQFISSSLFGGIVGAVIADRFNLFRDRRNRKIAGRDAFLSVLTEQRARLYAVSSKIATTTIETNSASEDAFFDGSIDALAIAVFKVRPFITKSEWAGLEVVLKDYQAQKHITRGADRLVADKESGTDYSDRLRTGLDKFYECITNAA